MSKQPSFSCSKQKKSQFYSLEKIIAFQQIDANPYIVEISDIEIDDNVQKFSLSLNLKN